MIFYINYKLCTALIELFRFNLFNANNLITIRLEIPPSCAFAWRFNALCVSDKRFVEVFDEPKRVGR